MWARISRAVAGSSDAVGSSSSSTVGRFSMALARHTRVCSPEESTPHFTSRNCARSNCSISSPIRSRQVPDSVNHAEDPQILSHGQVSRQRRVDRREVGAGQRLRPVGGHIQPFDPDGAAVRLEHAQNHVDDGGLPRAVGAQQPDDLVAPHVERNAVHGNRVAVCLRQFADGEYQPTVWHAARAVHNASDVKLEPQM